jgi:hypothetical protein
LSQHVQFLHAADQPELAVLRKLLERNFRQQAEFDDHLQDLSQRAEKSWKGKEKPDLIDQSYRQRVHSNYLGQSRRTAHPEDRPQPPDGTWM